MRLSLSELQISPKTRSPGWKFYDKAVKPGSAENSADVPDGHRRGLPKSGHPLSSTGGNLAGIFPQWGTTPNSGGAAAKYTHQ